MGEWTMAVNDEGDALLRVGVASSLLVLCGAGAVEAAEADGLERHAGRSGRRKVDCCCRRRHRRHCRCCPSAGAQPLAPSSVIMVSEGEKSCLASLMKHTASALSMFFWR